MASMLDRAIAAIADFNNPFYAEERQRDVANEAAAFGFGVLVWTLLFGAGATCWFFPEHYMAAGVLAVWVFLVCGLTSSYARRLGVTFLARDRNAGYPRRLAYGLVGAWVGAGWVRARFGVPLGDDLVLRLATEQPPPKRDHQGPTVDRCRAVGLGLSQPTRGQPGVPVAREPGAARLSVGRPGGHSLAGGVAWARRQAQGRRHAAPGSGSAPQRRPPRQPTPRRCVAASWAPLGRA